MPYQTAMNEANYVNSSLRAQPALFQDLICLQYGIRPNAVKNAQCYVMAQTTSKQRQTESNWLQGFSAFDTKKHTVSNVACLDRNRITKTSTERHWCLKATMSHNNGIKTALIPMFKNNSQTLISLSKILFLESPKKHFTNNQLKR